MSNRTVLHLLEALQVLQVRLPGGGAAEARKLSFRSLDIEQIGHVYEGLLDHTAKRAAEPVLGLQGTRNKEPEIALTELEKIAAKGEKELLKFLKDETGRSESALKKGFSAELDDQLVSRFRTACQDSDVWKRVKPFAGLVRLDTFGYPVVITTGSVFVTAGTDRRSSGTHYTPKSLTEPIVQYTLEPLVYVGPAEGSPKNQWKLRTAKELLALKICDMACGSGAFLVQACRYMAARLLEAWDAVQRANPGTVRITPEGEPSTGQPGEMLIPDDPDERQTYALRIVAQRCLYGVDKNPLAVEMAKLSLWLLTLAKDKPFEFLDHAIRCGDSLVGIHNTEQLRKFNLDGKGEDNRLFLHFLDEKTKEAIALRRQITEMQANTVEDVEAQDRMLREANEKIDRLKCAADMLISAEFVPGSAADKRAARDDAAIKVAVHFHDSDLPTFRREVQKALAGQVTFHWPLEFPEVMVERGGFDAFVGNPPFMGGLKLETAFGTDWRAYLVDRLADGVRGVRGTGDLCAYFLLRTCQLINDRGGTGILATNTISEGDSRAVGLDQLAERGFLVHRAVRSCKWPGTASLEVSQVWMRTKGWHGEYVLDDHTVSGITPHLTQQGAVTGKPKLLAANVGIAFQGSIVLGKGLVLDSNEGVRLRSNPKNADVVLPYMNGDDLNSRFDQTPSRWVINFLDWPLGHDTAIDGYQGPCASDYPDCLSIVEQRAKPERMAYEPINAWNKKVRTYWWHFGQYRWALDAAMSKVEQVLVACRHTKYVAHSLVTTAPVFDVALNVVVFPNKSWLSILESSIYEAWVRSYGSSLETRLRYTLSDCFEAFPFPYCDSSDDLLATNGEAFHSTRQVTMEVRKEGLTEVYNRFHEPDDTSDDIQKLRQLHVEMDNAVAAAYGWTDLDLGHGFHETKQGVRYTISEPARREVLTRLLKLNHERYAEEVKQGLHEKKKPRNTRKTRKKGDEGGGLFE